MAEQMELFQEEFTDITIFRKKQLEFSTPTSAQILIIRNLLLLLILKSTTSEPQEKQNMPQSVISLKS